MSTRLVVLAHFDVHGEVAAHVRHHVEAWAGVADRLVVVSTAALTPAARRWLAAHAELVERPNHGYDFVSYQVGLAAAGPLDRYDEVVLCNDSFVGPLRPYAELFAEMAEQPVDFWGLTLSRRVAPHVQSFFVVFRPWLVASPAFARFWAEVAPLPDRQQVIQRYEVGLSRRLTAAGFVAGQVFEETPEDARVARRRMRWWATHRSPGLTPRTLRDGRWRRRAEEAWNPTIALADRALPAGRLPLVKIDTLRYDPYQLGAEALLGACEDAFPGPFAGVREHLERTRTHYPRRAREELLATPRLLRPVGPLVGYAR